MGKNYCSMTGCHNYSGRIGKYGKEVTLHKLPKDNYTRRAWIRCISRKYWKPTSYTRVCSDHFSDGVGPTYLTRHKLRTENLAQKSYDNGKKEIKRVPRKRIPDPSPELAEVDPMETLSLSLDHGYAEKEEEVMSEVSNSNGIGTQTTVESSEAGCSTSMPDLVIEDIKNSDEDVLFFTGLPNYKTFNALFKSLMDAGADKLSTENVEKMNTNNLGRKRKLRRVDEFFLVLMRLRLGSLLKELEFKFKISASTVSKIFNCWISFMYECMQAIVFLPSLELLQTYIPLCFKGFPDTRIVLDCTEIFVQTPSTLENRALTYSNYKSHDTFKALVGVSMTGAVTFVSKLWPGLPQILKLLGIVVCLIYYRKVMLLWRTRGLFTCALT